MTVAHKTRFIGPAGNRDAGRAAGRAVSGAPAAAGRRLHSHLRCPAFVQESGRRITKCRRVGSGREGGCAVWEAPGSGVGCWPLPSERLELSGRSPGSWPSPASGICVGRSAKSWEGSCQGGWSKLGDEEDRVCWSQPLSAPCCTLPLCESVAFPVLALCVPLLSGSHLPAGCTPRRWEAAGPESVMMRMERANGWILPGGSSFMS